MKYLENAILKYGKVLPGNILKVGYFLNNQLDIKLLKKLGKEFFNYFKNYKVEKILTVETSGIALACLTAEYFNCNVVFAKKSKTANIDGEVYTSKCHSYTHNDNNNLFVPKEFLNKNENILVIDDFLAHGDATSACIDLIKQARANLIGIGIAIEKGFQGGGDNLREKGFNLCSLAIVDSMNNGKIEFRKN